MKIINRIYEGCVLEYYHDEEAKAVKDIFYTNEDAVRFCTEYVKRRFQEIYHRELVINSDLLGFMNDENYRFRLLVTERSGEKHVYESQNGYAKEFHKVLATPDENLYDRLLGTIFNQLYEYDYLGNRIRHFTNPESNTSFVEGNFTEVDCRDGKYRGDFMYHASSQAEPYTIPKYYYYACTEVIRDPIEGDNGYDSFDFFDNDETEALQSAGYSLYREMDRYLGVDEEGYRYGLTDEQEQALFKEHAKSYTFRVLVIRGKRVKFDSVAELAVYYAEQLEVCEPTKEALYDLLLSMVQYEERLYDKERNYLCSRIKRQEINGSTDYDVIPEFSKETIVEILKNQKKWKEKLYEDFY